MMEALVQIIHSIFYTLGETRKLPDSCPVSKLMIWNQVATI